MLDIKFIRENPDFVKKGVENKNEKNTVDKIISLDAGKKSYSPAG